MKLKTVIEKWKPVQEWYAEVQCPLCKKIIDDGQLYDIAEIEEGEEYKGKLRCCYCKKVFNLELS